MSDLSPLTSRDFSRGRYAKSVVSPGLAPLNSVANSINVNFDEIIGSAKVRPGTTAIGNQIVGTLVEKESYPTYDSDSEIYDTNWRAQTFVAINTYTLKAIKLRLFRTGTLSASWRVRLFPVDGSGVPVTTGTPLSKGAIMDTQYISTSVSGTDYLIPMSDYNITAATTYAIVVDVVGGDATHLINWRGNILGGPSGKGYNSSDSGATWTAFATFDFVYALYGISGGTETPLGYTQYRTFAGAQLNDLIAVYDMTDQLTATSSVLPGPSGKNAVLFYYNETNWAVGYIGLDEDYKTRFSVFGGRLFMTNPGDGMLQTDDPENTPVTTNCITTDSVKPALLIRAVNRLLASGYPGFSSRVYFSSIISPNSNPFITWNTDPTDGDWIDLNPDDGGVNTAFANTPSTTIVFKNNGFYRLDSINKTASPDPVSPIGAVSQEAVTNCQGIVYYFSGTGIWRTNGDVPELISRLGVQDFIDAIPQANWENVALGADDFTVRVSIGDITLNENQDNERQLTNVVLKFSVRDQSWSVHAYAQEFRFFSQYLTSAGSIVTELDTSGYSQQLDEGMTDNGSAINFEVETQELEFGNRSHLKKISDKMVSFNKYGQASSLQLKSDDGDYVPVRDTLENRVNICKSFNIEAYFITLKWFGQSTGKSPIWEGFEFTDVTDQGVIEKS